MQIVAGTKEDLQDGDIYLVLDAAVAMMEEEGYYLKIGGSKTDQNYTVVRGHGTTGVYYGAISILQILKQDEQRAHLPKGIARNYPQFEERGMMLVKDFTFATSSKDATIHVYMTPIAAGPDKSGEYCGNRDVWNQEQGDSGLGDGAVIPHHQMSAFASS